MRLIVATLIVLALAPVALAEVTVSFPLQGYYRPGRVMSVVVEGGEDASARLSAEGAVPTEVLGPMRDGVTVPWLPLATLRDPRVVVGDVERAIGQPLYELGDDERLIGVGRGLDVSRVAALYTDDRLIPIPIDGTAVRRARPWEWETLDAVVLDAAPEDDEVARLLGAGVTIAVASDGPPDDRWPWRQIADAWVVEPPARVPEQLVMPRAYLPVQAWAPGRPAGYRRQVVVMGTIAAIVLLALSLWRSRGTTAAAVVAVVVFSTAVHLWARGRGLVVEQAGTVSVTAAGIDVRDRWTWLTSLEPVGHASPFDARPVVASLRHLEATGLRIRVEADDEPRLAFDLRPGLVLALRDRTVLIDAEGPGSIGEAAGGGPLMPFVRAAYLVPGTSVVGTAGAPSHGEHDLGHVVLRYEIPD